MVTLRAIPRSSFALIVSALIIAAAISFNTLYTARSDNHDQTFYACLYAGSLSQVNTTAPPANCGRGSQIQWTSAVAAAPFTFVVRSDVVIVEPNETQFAIAECENGEIATGGGYFASLITLVVNGSQPLGSEPPNGWSVEATNTSSTQKRLEGYVVCMSQG